jgi:5-methyltetrahydrofolate corrinoid/iron sulfur protein methyltransferase
MVSVIADPLDDQLIDIAKGKRPDIVELIHKAMDGEAPPVSELSKEMADYSKTVDVILGRVLYSDSWLGV